MPTVPPAGTAGGHTLLTAAGKRGQAGQRDMSARKSHAGITATVILQAGAFGTAAIPSCKGNTRCMLLLNLAMPFLGMFLHTIGAAWLAAQSYMMG